MPSAVRDAVTAVPFGLEWADFDDGCGALFLVDVVSRTWIIVGAVAILTAVLGSLVWCPSDGSFLNGTLTW